MAAIDLRGGTIVISGRTGEVAQLTKAEVTRAKDEAEILAKLTAVIDDDEYYFNFDALVGGWECISGPKGLPRPQASEWPSAHRGGAF